MPALLIILAIVAFFTFLLFVNVSLIVEQKEKTALILKILFFKINLLEKRSKKLKKSMSKKEAQKIKDKLEKEKKKKKKKEKREKEESGEEEKKTPSDILFIIQTVADILKSVISGLSKYLRIKLAKIYVKVGTPDAATTAIAYGAITQGINVIMPLLEQTRNFSQSKNCKFNVEADFTSEE